MSVLVRFRLEDDRGGPRLRLPDHRVPDRAVRRVPAERGAAGEQRRQRRAGAVLGPEQRQFDAPARSSTRSSADITFSETRFKTAELNLGWSYNSLNRALFPDKGTRHSVGLSYTVPGSEVEYYVASYDFLKFIPFWGPFALSINLSVAYGGALGDTTSLPPYRNFYAGGPDSVRGYRESRLGPKDNFGNPYGGNLRTVGRVEAILPLPAEIRRAAPV